LTVNGNEATKYPIIKNDPKIIKVPDGYTLNWSLKSDNIELNYDINLKYIIKYDEYEKPHLVCKSTDKVVDKNFERFLCKKRTIYLAYSSYGIRP
ncbi:hypothetical protein QN374_16450, partial [Herbaspirillum sp. RTI4]